MQLQTTLEGNDSQLVLPTDGETTDVGALMAPHIFQVLEDVRSAIKGGFLYEYAKPKNHEPRATTMRIMQVETVFADGNNHDNLWLDVNATIKAYSTGVVVSVWTPYRTKDGIEHITSAETHINTEDAIAEVVATCTLLKTGLF